MKISIGTVKDKNIWDVIETNVENGYVVYCDEKHYYVDVLNYPTVYIADDVRYQHIPSGMYIIKNDIVYTVDDVQTWINL
jgi:hypothetical protein